MEIEIVKGRETERKMERDSVKVREFTGVTEREKERELKIKTERERELKIETEGERERKPFTFKKILRQKHFMIHCNLFSF